MSFRAAAWINYNGECYAAGKALLTTTNRGLRYGDGLFETMLVQDGRIRLEEYHFDRLWIGMGFLDFQRPLTFTRDYLRQQILELCRKNGYAALARVRLMIFRGEGTVFDTASNAPNFVIESSPLTSDQIAFNSSGLRIGVYPEGFKACDLLATLKTNNFLLYTLAARYARGQGWDDCLVLNSNDRVADSCIANLFYFRGATFYTPPVTEGCVGGVMRHFLLDRMLAKGLPVEERPVTVEDLRSANEIFLTNAVRTIQWVGDFEGKSYQRDMAQDLYRMIIKEA